MKNEEKEDSNHWIHANDYNHMFYAFICVDFNGINLWSTMPFQTPMTEQIRKETYPFKPITLSNYASFRPSFHLLFCWSHWYINDESCDELERDHLTIAGQTENPLQFLWLHFNISSKRQLKSLLGCWYSIFGPKSLQNDIGGWNYGRIRIYFCYNSTSNTNFSTQTKY